MTTITTQNTDGKTITVESITREDYLVQVRTWKAEYAELSKNIRAIKLKIKAAQRAVDGDEVASLTMSRAILKDYATAAIEERKHLKLRAKASYEHDRKEERLAA